jgi:tetratricopeptide (TPR) repeat protein
VALYRAGEWTRAIAELDEAVRLARDEAYSINGFALAMVHWRLGHQPQALTYFDRSVCWMELFAPADPELIALRAEAESLLDTSRPRQDFRGVLGDFPAHAYSARGMALGALGQWAQARAALRNAVDAGRRSAEVPSSNAATIDPSSEVWLALAALELDSGDSTAYRACCREMNARFSTSADFHDRERMARAWVLSTSRSHEEFERLNLIIQSTVSADGDKELHRRSLLTQGLAEYRAGRWKAAMNTLDRCLEDTPLAAIEVATLVIQAMALVHLDRAPEAEDRLERANQLIAKPMGRASSSHWLDRLIARRLAREAEFVVRLEPLFPDDPFTP